MGCELAVVQVLIPFCFPWRCDAQNRLKALANLRLVRSPKGARSQLSTTLSSTSLANIPH